MDDAPSRFKTRAFPELARIGQALASDRRLFILDLLAQAPRHVDAIADALGMPVANASQHLQVLRAAHLVDSERHGTRVVYRLAGDDVVSLWMDLLEVGRRRVPEIEHVDREVASEPARDGAIDRASAEALLSDRQVLIIDVRPTHEYDAGHLPGAVSIPVEDLPARAGELPPDRRIIAYCRGRYCLSADEAVQLLRARGFDAVRLEGGWPEWKHEGRPAAT